MAAPRAHRTALGSYEFRPGTGQVSLSASLRQMAGTAQPLLALDAFLTLVHPDDRSQVTAVMCRAGGPGPRVASCRFRRESGDLVFTVLRADASRRGESHDVLLSGLVLDLTPGYESYKAVRQSPDEAGRLAAVLAESAVPLLLSDGTRILAANQACVALTGPIVPGAEIAGEMWTSIGLAAMATVLRAGTRVGPRIVRMPPADGAPALVLVLADRVTLDGTPAMLVGLLDASLRLDPGAAADQAFGRLAEATAESLALVEAGAIVDCSDAFADALGRSVDDLRGRRITELVTAETAPAVAQDLAADSGDPHVWHFVHRDGRDVVLEARVRPGPAGDRGTRVLALRDLAERDRADHATKALEASREQFRELAESHGDGVVLLDADRIVHANSKFASMLGLGVDDVMGRALTTWALPDPRRLSVSVADAEEPFVLTLQHADGSTIAADVAPRSVNVAGRMYQVATVRDVTRRERAERLRRELFARTAGVTGESFFAALVEHLAAALQVRHVFIAECVGSPATSLDLLSRWRDGTRQAPFTRKLAGTPCELVLAHGAQCFTNDVTSLFPGDPLLASTGAVGYFGAPLFDSGGQALGVLAVIDDGPIERTDEREDLLAVSAARASVELQRSRFEREIRRLNADLERRVADRTAELRSANRELEAFSYSVSHDLRAPVRHITGFVDRLRQHAAGMSAAGREYVDDIATAAGRMSTLIDTLLEFSRTARSDMQAGVVDLTELADSVVAELTKEAPDRRVEWRIGAVPLVRGDRQLLRQVLVNLLGNAFKYSRGRDVARIELGTAPGSPSGDVVLFVRDNGVGFDMKYASRLFGVFQRLHAAKDFEGTGIGLANVHQIVTRHGGHVWAEAAVNAGATFFVSLPSVAVPVEAAS